MKYIAPKEKKWNGMLGLAFFVQSGVKQGQGARDSLRQVKEWHMLLTQEQELISSSWGPSQ